MRGGNRLSTIILFGGPSCAGKTTQARTLGLRLRIPVISSGDIARRLDKPSKESQKLLESGGLSPHGGTITTHLHRQIKELRKDGRPAVILDGYPREAMQYIKLKLEFATAKIFLVWLKVSPGTSLERAETRKRRGDEEGARKRYSTYRAETVPVLDFICRENQFIQMDPLECADKDDIAEMIHKYFKSDVRWEG